jgi:hypothetical protein
MLLLSGKVVGARPRVATGADAAIATEVPAFGRAFIEKIAEGNSRWLAS